MAKNTLDLYLYLKNIYRGRLELIEIVTSEVSILKGRIDGVPFEIQYNYARFININTTPLLKEELESVTKNIVYIGNSIENNNLSK